VAQGVSDHDDASLGCWIETLMAHRDDVTVVKSDRNEIRVRCPIIIGRLTLALSHNDLAPVRVSKNGSATT
jgi:hypothetical protein